MRTFFFSRTAVSILLKKHILTEQKLFSVLCMTCRVLYNCCAKQEIGNLSNCVLFLFIENHCESEAPVFIWVFGYLFISFINRDYKSYYWSAFYSLYLYDFLLKVSFFLFLIWLHIQGEAHKVLQSDSTQTIDHIQKCFRQKFQFSRRP